MIYTKSQMPVISLPNASATAGYNNKHNICADVYTAAVIMAQPL